MENFILILSYIKKNNKETTNHQNKNIRFDSNNHILWKDVKKLCIFYVGFCSVNKINLTENEENKYLFEYVNIKLGKFYLLFVKWKI